MTYNFDPDRWYEGELAHLQRRRAAGELDEDGYATALTDLDHRYEAMVDRLDGTYRVAGDEPPGRPPKP